MESETNEIKKEQPAVNTGEGFQREADAIIERANSARQKLEEENKRAEELLSNNKEILARQILGGRTNAGQQPIPVKEETPQEYAKRLSDGKF